MRCNLYHNFFAKDKPLRHISQHLLIAFFSFYVFTKAIHIPFSSANILLFVFFTLIPDVDGIIVIFTTCKNNPVAKEIRRKIAEGKFLNATTVAATHHKKLNRLLLHNVVFLIIVGGGLYTSTLFNNNFWKIGFGAVLTHFLFDILDDLYQLKHIKNWLWFIYLGK